MTNKARPRILVLGGGFGGLEALFYLRMRLGDEADLTLVSDQDHFLFRPNLIYVPFGEDPERLKLRLDHPMQRKNISLVRGKVLELDPAQKIVESDGDRLPYDYLVIATGADMRPEEIPGLGEYSQAIWSAQGMLKLRRALESLLEQAKAGNRQRVLFVVPPNNKCSGPLYEIVLMLDTWLRERGVRDKVEIVWTTYERNYIQVFGPRLHDVTRGQFERRGIEHHTEWVVQRVEEKEVVYGNGEHRSYDVLISFPPYVAAVKFPGLPTDDRGFISTELATRQVVGHPDIYAIGDASDFPVKQAFLAFLHGDASAEHLASRIIGKAPSMVFEPTSMCIMEQFDNATFAQVPLRLTGRPELPVEVRPEAASLYRVGTSVPWRLGKTLIFSTVFWRFGRGEPFHAGTFWSMMDAGLRVMSRFLAA